MGITYYSGSLGFVDGSSNVHVLYPKTRTSNVYNSSGQSLDTIISNINSAISSKADDGHNHDDTYLQLSGGTMTGTIVTPESDSMGIEPKTNDYGRVGATDKRFHKGYFTNINVVDLLPYKTSTGHVGISSSKFSAGYINSLYTTGGSIASGNGLAVNGGQVYNYFSSLHSIQKSNSESTKTIPNNSWTNIVSRTLTAGGWLINATVRYATAPTNIELSVSAASADWHPINNDYEFITSQVFPANGSINKTVRVTGFLELTSSTKIYLNTSQVNTSSASIVLNNWTFTSVKLYN